MTAGVVGRALSWSIALLVGVSVPVFGQETRPANSASAAPADSEADQLGRDTPRGTILGFNLAVRRGDFVSAKLYMQITAAQRDEADTLARELGELIDSNFGEPLTALSTSRLGTANDGLPLDRDRVALTIDGQPYDLVLVRVADPQAGLVWLISSESIAQVPLLYRSARVPELERMMPGSLVNARLFGMSLARWLAYVATVVIPFGGLSLLSIALIKIARRAITSPTRRERLELWYGGMRRLTVVVLAILVHLTLMRYLAFSLRFRYVYSRFALVALVVAVAWLAIRFLSLATAHARLLALRRGQVQFSSLLMLVQRVGKVLIALIAVFVILNLAGVDTTTALAGVGIGGIAIALGAQKSIENLLGGVFLITDNALAVGDQCRIADRLGSVEDITLRSVRLRTPEQTLLSIPAGVLAQANIENFSTRGKILVQTILRLRHETSVGQIRSVLADIQELLVQHRDIEAASARVRLVEFSAQAVELELFAYVLTSDMPTFLAVREELLLKIAEIVEGAGTTFARPTDLYLRDPTGAAAKPQNQKRASIVDTAPVV